MDPEKAEETLVQCIKKFLTEQGKSKVVLGLSGGLDSALTLSLLVKSLGAGNVTVILMPNTKITKKSSTTDAENFAKKLGVKYFVVPIDETLKSFKILPWEQSKIAEANLNARARALILYNYANSSDSLVVGTGNKTEYYLGYFTKYGDAAADFFPIADLFKTQVRELAFYLKVPREFLDKKPTAELWENQEDEKELGITYEIIDELLPLILENKESEIPGEKKEAAEKIKLLIKTTEHKRNLPKVILMC